MAVLLTLGSILFSDFEIPESTNFGGEQMLAIRKLVGGDRVIDAMGRDDDDIHWSGRFRGAAAEGRARLLDYMRIQGQSLVLSWSSFRYLVVIRSFKADLQVAGLEIPYSIVCTVMEDLTNPILPSADTADTAINSDVNGAVEATADIGIPDITTAVASVSSATGSIDSFQSASSAQITAVQSAINIAVTKIGNQTTSLNATVAGSSGVAGAVGGGSPATIIANLTDQSTALAQLSGLYRVGDLMGRASINVANSGA